MSSPLTEGGLGAAIVQAKTVEQMVTERQEREERAAASWASVTGCGKFCQECSCCLACSPDCCEGGCR